MAKEGKARVLNENEFKRLLIMVKEIAALTFKDVVDQEFKVLDEVNLKRAITKGEKQRHVYITNKKITTALQEYVDAIRIQEKEAFNLKAPLFKTQRRSRFHLDVLQKWFRKLYDKTGLTWASSHSGRRTFITRLIEQGADIKAVSRLAGHANIATTSEYVENNPDRLKRISSLAIF